MLIETSEFNNMFSVRYKVPGIIGYVKWMSFTSSLYKNWFKSMLALSQY